MVRQWSVSRIWKCKFSTWEADCVFTLFQFLKITSSLEASLHLYESACPSVAPSVHDAYVMLMLYFGKKMRKIENFMCRNDQVGIEVMEIIKTALSSTSTNKDGCCYPQGNPQRENLGGNKK